MTIKRRLFISNVLMILIPLLVGLAAAFGADYFLSSLNSLGGIEAAQGIKFPRAMSRARSLIEHWKPKQDIAQMLEDVKSFNESYSEGDPLLVIYKNGKAVSPQVDTDIGSVLDFAILQNEPSMIAIDKTAVYIEVVGDYKIILTTQNFSPRNPEYYKSLFFTRGIIFFICVISTIIVTNRFLTRFVFKKIVTSLDTLANGVQEIRNGNLNYSIDYPEKDEFSGVCSDFNEMAVHLLESVKTRQKDEANRKELIAGISHDLRTPLTSIKAYSEGLESGLASNPQAQKRYIDTIKNKVSDLESIIDTLFLFSKLDIGEFPYHMEQVFIDEELSSTVSAIKDDYKRKGLDATLDNNVQHASVKIDTVQFRSVIINILENSLKYKDKERVEMKISTLESDKGIKVIFTDNGPGVPKDTIEKLFDIFYRGDSSRSNPSKGSGLGLAISSKIVKSFGGTIKAENAKGRGLAIIIELPKCSGEIS